MDVTHDRHYICPGTKELIDRGYAVEDLHSLRFQFVYTQTETARNREQSAMRQKAAIREI